MACSARAQRIGALLLAIAVLVGVSPAFAAQAPGEDAAIVEAKAVFNASGPAFAYGNGSANESARWANQFELALPILIELPVFATNAGATNLLGQISWQLIGHEGSKLDAVFRASPKLRELMSAVGDPAIGSALDDRLSGFLIGNGHWQEGLETIQSALETWPQIELSLLAKRANLHRRLQNWHESRADLDRASISAATKSIEEAWAGVAEFEGVRAQLEIAFGRLDFAARALERGRNALEYGESNFGADHPQVRFLGQFLATTEIDLYLTAERYELVEQQLSSWIPGDATALDLPAPMRAQLALAYDGLEREDPARPKLADRLFEQLVTDETLAVEDRIVVATRKAVRHLAANELEACEAAISLVESSLDELRSVPGWSLPLQEVASLRMVQSRLARAQGASQSVMAERLGALDFAFVALLDAWSATPVLPGGLGFLQWGTRQEILAELITLRVEVDPKGAEACLDDVLAAQTLGTLSRRLALPVPSLAQVQSALVQGGGILIYVPSIRGGHILSVDDAGVELYTLMPKVELLQLAESATANDYSPDSTATLQLANALLPAGLLKRVQGWQHMYLIGLPELEGVRFESLPIGDAAETIGRAVAIAELPSLPVGVWLAHDFPGPQAVGPKSLSLWVASEPTRAARTRFPNLETIPFGERERKLLVEPFCDVELAPPTLTPTFASIQKEEFDETVVLALLCHGIWDADAERPASLVLAPASSEDDGLVGCDQVEDPLRPYPTFVNLLACGAALGPKRKGDDGVSHLGGAFLKGGAHLVLVADGDLNYGASLRFNQLLHEALADGATPAAAMRDARLAVDGELPLRLIGLAHLPLFEPRSGSKLSWILSAFVGVALILLVASRVRTSKLANR